MSTFQARVTAIVQRDPRYAYEAYEFVFAALSHTQRLLGRTPADVVHPGPEHHVSGRELVEGIRDLALREFGLMARVVFRMWGIHCTGDFGEIVFNLVAENMMSKSDQDSRTDFQDVFDLDQALVQGFHLALDEAEGRR